jgi:hypothetical protein
MLKLWSQSFDSGLLAFCRQGWADRLDPNVPASEVLKYLALGTLTATRVYLPPSTDAQTAFAL